MKDKVWFEGLPRIGRYLVQDGSFVNLRETSSTKKYETHDGFSFWELREDSEKELLLLISCVKKDAKNWFLENKFSKNEIDTSKLPKPSYYGLNTENGLIEELKQNKDGVERKVIKMDISQAYWTTAKKVFLSEKTYELGSKFKKKNRLKALGALATNYTHKVYQESELVDVYNKRKDTSFLFFYCAKIVDDLMKELMSFTHEFSDFYWTDCIVLNSKKEFIIKSVHKICENYGYHIKYEESFLKYKLEEDVLLISMLENKEYKPYINMPVYGKS
jgi:hypothetical protein